MKTSYNEATTLKNSTLEQDLLLCEKSGFDYIEIWICQLDKYLKEHTLDELKVFFESHRLKPFALDSFEDILFCDDIEYERLKARFERACLLGHAINCNKAVMVPTVKEGINDKYTREQITQESVKVLIELAEIAKPYGMKLAFEPIGFECCAVRSIEHAWEIVKKVDLDNVGLTLDVFNNYLYDALNDMNVIKEIPADKILIFHVDDAKKQTLSTYKLDHSDRVAPGDGELPCIEMLKKIAETGYDDGVSIELFNSDFYSMDAGKAVERSYEAVKRLISSK